VERISTACPVFSCTIRKLFIAAIFVAAAFWAGLEGAWEYEFGAQKRRIANQIRGYKFWRSLEQEAEKPHG
jgi:hypothetical protein